MGYLLEFTLSHGSYGGEGRLTYKAYLFEKNVNLLVALCEIF